MRAVYASRRSGLRSVEDVGTEDIFYAVDHPLAGVEEHMLKKERHAGLRYDRVGLLREIGLSALKILI